MSNSIDVLGILTISENPYEASPISVWPAHDILLLMNSLSSEGSDVIVAGIETLIRTPLLESVNDNFTVAKRVNIIKDRISRMPAYVQSSSPVEFIIKLGTGCNSTTPELRNVISSYSS